ncbi:MAG: TIGR00341 family protein [Candidatus Thorarchaeota archaeon]|nr:MAG: TIGR00341 family protein [Candidatus Thorarchaeota archaeon]
MNSRSGSSVKLVQIVLPYGKTEGVYNFLVDAMNVVNIQKIDVGEAHLLFFRIPDDKVFDMVEALKSRGLGIEYGLIDVIDTKVSLPGDLSEESQEEKIQREAALAVEEIFRNVTRQASLSFDFIAFCVLAALMAGVGLIQNNVTVIVASMLLSPLMGPMLGVALGYVVGDRELFIKGTRNELLALGVSFAVGAIMALIMPFLYPGPPSLMDVIESDWTSTPMVLTEITRRGGFSVLDVGVAIFSGAAVAVSITRGDMSSLVGVAISAALMPPAVNVGMMLTLGFVTGSAIGIQIGIGSLMLLTMNIILIDVAAVVMFRIKKLGVIPDKSARWIGISKFKQRGSEGLYHHVADAPRKQETPEAAFKPAEQPVSTPPPEPNGDRQEPASNG